MTSNITAAVDVNRPIRTVYNQWSQRPGPNSDQGDVCQRSTSTSPGPT